MEEIMMKIPNCEICKHYIEQRKVKKMCCNAFPDGIPLDVIIKAGPGVECTPGYIFEEKEDGRIYKESSPNGLYSRIMECKRKLNG